MNPQDKSFMMTFTAVLGVLVLLSVVFFLAARAVSVISLPPPDDERILAIAERRIQPVGRVVTGDAEEAAAEPATAVARSGEEVYQQVCTACHVAGVAGAPVSGDNAAWSERYRTQGLDTLVRSVIDGLNAMPPRAGNPNLSDEDIRSAVVHMLQAADVQVEDAAPAESAPAVAEAPAAEPAGAADAVDLARGQAVYNQACTVCHAAGLAGAPLSGDNAVWSERFAQGFDVLVAHAINGLNAMPPRGGHANLSDEEIRDSVAYMLDAAGVDYSGAPEADVAGDTAEQPSMPVAAPAPEAAPDTTVAVPDAGVVEAQLEAMRMAVEAAERAAQAAERAAQAAERAAEAAAQMRDATQPAPVPEQEPAPAPEPASEAPAERAADESASVAPDTLEIPVDLDLARGEQLYNTACIICHDVGVAGAPRPGDRQAWSTRLAGGWEALARHSLEGHLAMPAKGGRIDLPDADILAAVAYMVIRSR